MIVVGHGCNDGHLPSRELESQWKREDSHVTDFVLWAMRRRKRPCSRDDLIDAYERYVEGLGATRTERRKAVWKIERNFSTALCRLSHYGRKIKEGPCYRFTLTDEGRAAVKGMKPPPVPETIYQPKGKAK